MYVCVCGLGIVINLGERAARVISVSRKIRLERWLWQSGILHGVRRKKVEVNGRRVWNGINSTFYSFCIFRLNGKVARGGINWKQLSRSVSRVKWPKKEEGRWKNNAVKNGGGKWWQLVQKSSKWKFCLQPASCSEKWKWNKWAFVVEKNSNDVKKKTWHVRMAVEKRTTGKRKTWSKLCTECIASAVHGQKKILRVVKFNFLSNFVFLAQSVGVAEIGFSFLGLFGAYVWRRQSNTQWRNARGWNFQLILLVCCCCFFCSLYFAFWFFWCWHFPCSGSVRWSTLMVMLMRFNASKDMENLVEFCLW